MRAFCISLLVTLWLMQANQAEAQVPGSFTEIGSCATGWALQKSGGHKSYNFCIEKAPGSAVTYREAHIQCFKKGASLCYANEWLAACSNSASLGLTGLPTAPNGEWLAGADPIVPYRVYDGYGGNTHVGMGCDYGGGGSALGPYNVRCCIR